MFLSCATTQINVFKRSWTEVLIVIKGVSHAPTCNWLTWRLWYLSYVLHTKLICFLKFAENVKKRHPRSQKKIEIFKNLFHITPKFYLWARILLKLFGFKYKVRTPLHIIVSEKKVNRWHEMSDYWHNDLKRGALILGV